MVNCTVQGVYPEKQQPSTKLHIDLKGITQKIWWIPMIIWGVVLVVVLAFVYEPARQKLPELMETVSYKNRLLEVRRSQNTKVEDTQEKLVSSRLEMESMVQAVPSEGDMPRILDWVCQVAEGAGGKISGIKYFLPSAVTKEFSNMRVIIDFQGSFGALEVLLRSLVKCPFSIGFSSLKISAASVDDNVLPASDILDAKLDLTMVVSKKSSVVGSWSLDDLNYGRKFEHSSLFEADPAWRLHRDAISRFRDIELYDFRLVGIIRAGDESVALIECKGESYLTRAGDHVQDVLVRSVSSKFAVLEVGNTEFVLYLDE